MAKRARGAAGSSTRFEAFAEDLGRLLGSAQAKAQDWLGQRQEIVKHLSGIRDTASKLLADLGHQSKIGTPSRGAAGARSGASAAAATGQGRRKRRKLSAAARKAISDAQKKRWAALKAKAK